MEAGQMALPLVGASRCGYCHRQLVRQPRGAWACPRCAPILVELGKGLSWDDTLAEYRRFVKAAPQSRATR